MSLAVTEVQQISFNATTFEAIAQSLVFYVWIFNRSGRIVSYNPPYGTENIQCSVAIPFEFFWTRQYSRDFMLTPTVTQEPSFMLKGHI